MNRIRTAATLLLTGLLASAAAQAQTKIGSVNLDRLFGEYQRQKDLALEMKQYDDRVQLEAQSRQTSLQQAQAALDAMAPSDPTYAERQRDFYRRQIDFRVWVETTQAEMAREAAFWTAKIYQEINQVVADVAQREGVGIVLHHEFFRPSSADPDQIKAQIAQRRVIYVSPDADLTQRVLDELNSRYRAQPQQPMLPQQP